MQERGGGEGRLLHWVTVVEWRARRQLAPAVGNLSPALSGISRLAEAQGPPRCSDVTDSSRECSAFLFLAVVRSFPASRRKKNTLRITFWSIWEQSVEEARGHD